MGILRTDRVAGLGGANAITGSVNFTNDGATSTGDYLRVDRKDNSDFNLSTNDFTIEFWMYSRNVGSSLHLVTFAASTVSASSDAGFYVRQFGGVVQGYCFEGNNSIGVVATGTISKERWYHIAYVRNGSTFTMYLDGTSTATASSAEAANFDASWNLNIGSAYTDVYHYNGYLSNLRIINGTALYTGNFTVPNTRLTNVSNTVLLACQSSGNVLQEGTNKNIHLVRSSNDNTTPQATHFTPNSPVGFSTTTDVGSQYGITFEDNTRFDTLSYMVPPGGNSRERNRGRGLIAGGCTPLIAEIEYIQIQSQGNSTTFGNLSATRFGLAGCASATRGLFGGGAEPSIRNYIEFVTIASTGENITDFGDLTAARRDIGALSNQTRGMWTGGNPGSSPNATDTIDFVTIATAGNASDFGNLTASMKEVQSTSSPTRGIMGGGNTVPATVNTIQFITIASTGNASDFGDLTRTAGSLSTASSATRAVFANGGTNTIDYITIASTGNATDFGDTTAVRGQSGGVSNSIRGVFTGGYQPSPTSSDANVIDFIEFATTGNAKDFGDIDRSANDSNREHGTCSDSHGGIS